MVPGINFPVNQIDLAICYGNLTTMSIVYWIIQSPNADLYSILHEHVNRSYTK